jgi:hypothetical protein
MQPTISLKLDTDRLNRLKKFSKIRKSSVSDSVRLGIDLLLSSDKKKKFEDTELFKWFGKFKYTDEIKKIEKELERSKDDYEFN